MFAILIVGIFIWIAAHYFKRLAPEKRANMGEAGKGVVTVALFISLALIIWGYRGAAFIPVWTPPSFMVHINNLLMLVAIFVFGMSATTGRLRGKMRHPQLTAVKIWAFAHLLVNGDLASILLFGAMLGWAVGSVILINRAQEWNRPEPGDPSKDKLLIIISLVMFGLITAVHAWFGVWPFPG